MEKAETLAGAVPAEDSEKRALLKRRFYDVSFALGFLCCLIPGPFPQLSGIASVGLLLFAAISLFDDNLYLYTALFIYLRYRLLLVGNFTAYRVYSLILVARLIKDFPKLRLQTVHLPALLVFALHCFFALARLTNLKRCLYVLVDCVLIYFVICVVVQDKRLLRRFLFAFMLGAVASGIYGWTSDAYTVDINIRGAGAQKVSRNFGALSDSNFAGLIYSLCVICAVTVKGLPLWLRGVFLALFTVMLLQTASLSAILTLAILAAFMIVLKYRVRSVGILLAAFAGAAVILGILLAIPQFREIDAIAGLIIRLDEKLSYITRGRLDLLTTGRSELWASALNILKHESWWKLLIGGNVVTVNYIDSTLMDLACHNSYLQSLLNFGILGTLLVYVPMLSMFVWRLIGHCATPAGYKNEDLTMIRLCFVFAFIVFGATVDFFIDWPYLILYFV